MNRASRQRVGVAKTIGGFLTSALIMVSITGTVVRAETYPFSPQTKIRVAIVQWIPTKGAYERWEPIGGDFLISDTGTVSLPVIGILQVARLDNDGLAAEIAGKLKSKIGLVETPLVTVEIIDRPPVYVVGDVASPGEYKFREGLTVLQALTMSGGVFRPIGAPSQSQDRLGYAGQLKEIADFLLRSDVRIVRLEAEISGSKDMVFDPNLQLDPNVAAKVFEQEKILHTARMSELDRQSKSYGELRELFALEIQTLGKKVISTDEDVASLQMQLGKIKGLVDRGIVIPSRQLELERLLRSYSSDRLDLDTSIMRARQGLAEATRNLDGLYDKYRTEVATALQGEKANQDQLKRKRDLTQALLLDILSQGNASNKGNDIGSLAFTIVRRENDEVHEDVAMTSTALRPGDVVNVSRDATKPSKNDVSLVMKTHNQN